MKDIQINVNTETNLIYKDSEILGISSENLQGKIIFKPVPFINGVCRLYVKNLGAIEMNKGEDCYTLPIKSSLLKSPGIDVCFKIAEPTNENGTPIFASKIVHLKVLDTIEDDSTIPEQYPSWIETFDSKIAEIQKLEETVSVNEEIRVENENKRILAEENREKTTTEAVNNIVDMTESYNANAEEKKQEINAIADGVKDMATAIQFATFDVDDNMELGINTAEKLANTSFDYNENTGELEVEIV